MNPTTKLWLAIIGIGFSAIATRCSFLLMPRRLGLPAALERALRYAPAAGLAAIVAPGLMLIGERGDFVFANSRLAAGLVAALVMWRTRGMLWAMAAGIAVYTVLRLAPA